MQWQKIWWAFPIVFTAFGYQCLIPTLYNYMNRNIAKVRTAIIIGTAIAFVIYTVWGLLTLGIVPCEAVQSIAQAIQNGTSFLDSPGSYLNSITMTTLGQAFCFFAMTTSFLGISLAFFDFLADGLKLRGKNRLHKSILCLSIFGLPLLVSWINPQLFLKILNLAGGFGVALLLGVIPILMIWAGRYFEGHSLLHQQLPGGKFTLSILAAFVIMVLIFTF